MRIVHYDPERDEYTVLVGHDPGEQLRLSAKAVHAMGLSASLFRGVRAQAQTPERPFVHIANPALNVLRRSVDARPSLLGRVRRWLASWWRGWPLQLRAAHPRLGRLALPPGPQGSDFVKRSVTPYEFEQRG